MALTRYTFSIPVRVLVEVTADSRDAAVALAKRHVAFMDTTNHLPPVEEGGLSLETCGASAADIIATEDAPAAGGVA